MKLMKRFVMITTSVLLAVVVAEAGDRKGGLFVNLTSSEVSRATMAVMIAQKVLTEKKVPVTLWLTVEGVRLADTRGAQRKYADGHTPLEMIQEFLRSGGSVMICPMCMQKVGGMEVKDLPAGVVPSEMDLWWKAISADDVRVLSY
jgi:predicted peroxiredoxin